MKKFLRTMMLAVLTAVPLASGAQCVPVVNVVGDSNSTVTNNTLPVCTYYGNSLTEMIIDADEFDTPMSIESIGFYYAYASPTTHSADVRIYMLETEKTVFSSSTDLVPVTADAVQVYNGALNCSQGWNDFTLSTPFSYSGEGNLLVIVHKNGGGYETTSSFKFATTACTGNKSIAYYSDSYNPDPTSATYSGSKAVYSYRPVMRLSGCEAAGSSCRKVTDLVVSDAGPSSVTLTWRDTVNSGATYSVYQTVEGVDVFVAGNFSDTTYTVTGLDANTEYLFAVVTNCLNGDDSQAKRVSGRTTCDLIASLPQTWGFEDSELQGTTSSLRIPWCWQRATSAATYPAYPYCYNNYAHTGSRVLYFYPGGTASYPDTQAVAMTPVDVSQFPMNRNAISFWGRMNNASNSALLYVYTTPNPANKSGYVLIDTVRISGASHVLYSVPLTSSPANNPYIVLTVYRGSTGYMAIDDLTLSQQALCGDITHLAVDSVSTTTVSLSWDVLAGSTFSVYDMTDTTLLVAGLTDNHYTVTGLSAMTNYTFGVRPVCSEGNGGFFTIQAATACGTSTLPFVEDFESTTYGCWSLVATHSSTGVTTANPYSGSHAFRFNYNTNPPQYLMSPELSGTENGIQVEFSYANEDNGSPESFAVGYSTTDKTPSSFTWGAEVTNIATNRAYQRYSEIISTPNVRYVAIKYTANNQYYLYIDSVVIKEAPSCRAVAGLTVDSVTTSSVFVSWSDSVNSGATYSIYVNGTEFDSGVSGHQYEISGLDAATTYTIGVVANCSSTDASDMATVEAYTSCEGVGCQLTFNCSDAYYDGWQGSYLTVSQLGVTVGTITCLQTDEVYTVNVCGGAPVLLTWNSVGEYDDEASFTVVDGGNNVVFTCHQGYADYFATGVPFDTIDSPCPSCPVPVVTLDSVTATSIAIRWAATNAIAYNVYLDGELEASAITDTYYEVTGLTAASGYTLSVEAICSDTDTSALASGTFFTDCENGTCEVTIVSGEYGLLAASVDVLQNGRLLYNFYDQDYVSYTESVSVCSGEPIAFVYHQTPFAEYGYANLINFTLYDGSGATVYSATGFDLADDSLFFTLADACPDCAVPVLAVDSVGQTAVRLSWTGTAASYDVYLDSALVQAGVSDTFYTFAGLTAATGYTLGVVARCSATDSSAMATVGVTTSCGAVTALPYSESFDADLGCWTTVNGSADGLPWFQEPEDLLDAHSGSGMALSVSYNNHAVHADAWLISPQFALPTTDSSLILSWWYMVDGYYPDDRYEVRLSTTTNDTASFAIQLTDVQPTELNGDWTQMAVDLTAYAGQSVYVAFHHYDSYDADFLALDDVEVYEGVYVEPEPDTLTVIFQVNNAAMGTTVPAPGTYRYGAADTVSFGSSATAGNRFAMWELTAIVDGESMTDTLDASYANGFYFVASSMMVYDTLVFKAYFEAGLPDSTTITYAVNDATMGTITPAPGTYTIYVGDSIVATASAAAGYELSGWLFETYRFGSLVNADSLSAVNPAFFAIVPQAVADNNVTITVTALFRATAATQYVVTLATADSDMGGVVPEGATYVNEGSSFTATATPNPGYRFVAWMRGTEQVSTANPYVFSVTEDVSLTATFEANEPVVTYYEVSVSSGDAQMGTVSSSVPTGQVAEGTVMTVSATPADGYRFLRWTTDGGAVVSTDNPYTFTVTADVHLVAVFEAGVGIDDVVGADVTVYSAEGRIVVRGVEGREVSVYDVNGRCVRQQAAAAETVEMAVSAAGVYLVKVGDAPAQRVVVVR